MKLNVVLGQDLSAYAEIEVEVRDDASKKQIVEAIKEEIRHQDDIIFEPALDSLSSLRIAYAEDEEGNRVLIHHPIEPILFDAGQELGAWLKGFAPLKAIVDTASELGLIDEPVTEAYRGTFTLHGAETVEVEFACRKGATREEKDLAFFEALAQIGTVNYVAIGDAPACSTCEHDCKDAGVCAITRQEV